MNHLSVHKDMDKKKEKELKDLNDKMLDEFLKFQISHDARAIIANQFSGQDLIVDLISQYSVLKWMPMDFKEKAELNAKLAQKAGIELPPTG